MKFSEAWLREWVNPDVDSKTLQHQLTMSGLEVDSAEPVAAEFSKVVVAEIKTVTQHPDADRLTVCSVDVGQTESLQIVCGAKNVAPGLKVPAAIIGAVLPGNFKIKKSKLRGVESQGMMCSAVELGLAEESDGLMPLPDDAPVGKNIREYLQLDDISIDIDLTPNRGDCLSVVGVAREVAAINQCTLTPVDIAPVPSTIEDTFPVDIQDKIACQHYVGRVIRNINMDAKTPLWMQERLRRSGSRSISPVVDVTNYVLLELGQPMHAFDLATLQEGIVVRKASAGEKLVLLDDQEVTLKDDILVIADHKRSVAMAGIMGGKATAVTDATRDIFLESAFFTPDAVAGHARQYGLSTDSSHRFERGVDPDLQVKAIERATQLLLDIVGGEAGPVIDITSQENLLTREAILVRHDRVNQLLGMTLDAQVITDLLTHLHLTVKPVNEGWQVTPSSCRFDISLEVDLIEEIARLYGYDNIPTTRPKAHLVMRDVCEEQLSLKAIKHALSDLSYHEAVTYSFVDDTIQKQVDPLHEGLPLVNPISSEMSVMRTSLFTGLLSALKYNQRRQQNRIRLFETGLRFIQQGERLLQQHVISGVICGPKQKTQWGVKTEKIDFFDVKGDVENLLKLTNDTNSFHFASSQFSMLHPGQSADITRNSQLVGCVGMLNPALYSTLDIQGPIGVFELSYEALKAATLTSSSPLSKFPVITRDIAFIVDEAVTMSALKHTIIEAGGQLLTDVQLFDLYAGEGIPAGQKSLAFSLSLQSFDRTLTDDEVNTCIDAMLSALKANFNITLRD